MRIPLPWLGGLLAAGLFAAPAAAQGDQALEKKLEEKLSHDFIDFGGWITDYDAARARARETGKVLFVYFSRSYAP